MPYLHDKPFHISPCTLHSVHMNYSFFVFSMINDDQRIFCNRIFWPLLMILLQGLKKDLEVRLLNMNSTLYLNRTVRQCYG